MFKFHLPHFVLDKTIQGTFKQAFKYAPAHAKVFKLLPQFVSLFEPVSSTFYICNIDKVDLGSVRGEWISRKRTNIKDDKVVLYIHGGGFVTCSPATHRIIASCLSKYTERKVFTVQYTLAPDKMFPTQINECIEAYKYLLSLGYTGKDIAIAGDSAGGNLALATTEAIAALLPENKPSCVVGLSPWADLTNNGPSIQYNLSTDMMIPPHRMADCRKMYVGEKTDEELRNPLISPAFADFSQFPPILIHVGGAEVLLSDAKFVNKNAKAQGAYCTLKVWEKHGHVFQMWAALHKDARQSLKEIANFMKIHWCV